MSNWRIDYNNDTGPSDEGYYQWWDVTNGERSFRVESSEADAEWLKAALERAGDIPEAGDLSWEQRERTIADGQRLLAASRFDMAAVLRGVHEAFANIMAYVRSKDDLYANGAIRQFAEEGLAAMGLDPEGNPLPGGSAVPAPQEPVAWRRKRYDAPNAPWVYRETPPDPKDPEALKLPYEALFTGPRNV